MLLLFVISQTDCFCLNELILTEAYNSNLCKNSCVFLLKHLCTRDQAQIQWAIGRHRDTRNVEICIIFQKADSIKCYYTATVFCLFGA